MSGLMEHQHGVSVSWVLICALLLMAMAYFALMIRLKAKGRRWSFARLTLFLAGTALLIWGFAPGYLPLAMGDFRNHMLQHLLLGMLAPIGIMMAAPLTLLLASLPRSASRRVVGVLGSVPLRVLTHPVVALVLDLGGMALLYFSPLYDAMMRSSSVHAWVHLHFILAGCLYTWVIAGPDPGPHRPSVPARLVLLGVAVVVHSVLSQLLYSGLWVYPQLADAERHQAAELMYYGGDIAEMLLAIALVTRWRPNRAPADSVHAPDSSGTISG